MIAALLAATVLTAAPPSQAVPREKLLAAAREMMISIRYCAAITVDENGRALARTVDPFPPDEKMIVWFATNRNSRKVKQLRRDPRITLYYVEFENH